MEGPGQHVLAVARDLKDLRLVICRCEVVHDRCCWRDGKGRLPANSDGSPRNLIADEFEAVFEISAPFEEAVANNSSVGGEGDGGNVSNCDARLFTRVNPVAPKKGTVGDVRGDDLNVDDGRNGNEVSDSSASDRLVLAGSEDLIAFKETERDALFETIAVMEDLPGVDDAGLRGRLAGLS